MVVRIRKGKEDVVCLSSKGKVGLIAHDYRQSGRPMPEPGERWEVTMIYEAPSFFIAMPIEKLSGTQTDQGV